MPLGPGSTIDGVYKYGESDATGPLFSDFLNLPGDGIRTRLNAGKVGDTGWTPITLAGTWVTSLSEVPRYRRLNGVIYLTGVATGGGATTLGTLPAGFRPIATIRMLVRAATSTTSTTWVQIDTTGLITTATGASPNLNAVASFPADN